VYLDEVLEGPSAPIPGLPGEAAGGGEDGGGDPEQDPLYDEAVKIVTESRKASISGVQRRLKIGYNRAARMIEAMEAAGLVGPLQSNGSREVLAPPPPEAD
jgi:S-DNA-T family DNA segregation ATPase FtsK/SpoIIIE